MNAMGLESIVVQYHHKFVYYLYLTLALDVIFLSEADNCLSGNGYLRPIHEKVYNHTMAWEAIEFGNISTIGKNLQYDDIQRMLEVKRDGSYFFHLTLHLERLAMDSVQSRVKVMLESDRQVLLSCEVKLPAGSQSVKKTKICWTISQEVKSGSRLCAQMIVHAKVDKHWKLMSNKSGLVIFLVSP